VTSRFLTLAVATTDALVALPSSRRPAAFSLTLTLAVAPAGIVKRFFP
jgi:hypothetical protein